MTQITPAHDKALLQELAIRKERLWRKGKLGWKLHAAQNKIYQTLKALPPHVTNRVILCARGFGKSYLDVILGAEDCAKPPFNHPVIIIGPEKQQMVEILSPIINSIAEDAPPGYVKRLKSESKWQIGNTQLVIAGFNRDSIDRLRGQRPKAVYIDEGRDVDPEDYKYGMINVIKPMCLHLMAPVTHTTTPPAQLDHPFLLETIPDAQLNGAFFKYTIYDNPLLTPEQIEVAIRECGGENSEAFRREYCAEVIRSAERTIVPQFREPHHVRDVVRPEHANWQISIDVGGVQDKTVALLGYFDFIRSRLCVVGERVWEPGTESTDIVQGSLELESYAKWKDGPDRIADAPGQLLIDFNSLHNYPARLPIKDQFDAQINNLQVAFANDQIEIDPACKFLIATLRNGMLNKKRNDYERSSTLGHCDAIAALSYMWRNIKRGNPFPQHQVNAYTEWQRPDLRPQHELKELASALSPRMKRR